MEDSMTKSSIFSIQVNDKGGKHFRKYTEDTLRTFFDASPTAANFELMVLIEGLVFMALRIHFVSVGDAKGYDRFVKKNDRLENAVKKLSSVGVVDSKLRSNLTNYRKMRNEISHNLFRMKSFDSKIFPKFKNYSYSKALADLFEMGMGIFKAFSTFMVPGTSNFAKKFPGFPSQKSAQK